MDILLNEEKIDFKLENEKTLGEVYFEIDNWLKTSGFTIGSLKKDNEIIDIYENEKWKKDEIDNISTLHIWVQFPAEQMAIKLNTIQQFFTIIIKALDMKNIQLINEISKNYYDIKIITQELLEKVKLNFSVEDFNKVDLILVDSGLLEGKLPENEVLNKFNIIVDSFIILLKSQIKELLDPQKELKSTIKLINNSLAEIENVSILLQTGKDKEAMDNILRFVELSQKILRIVPFLKENGLIDMKTLNFEGLTFEEFYKGFNVTLIELTEAFAANDSVLIGDILEYEIVPKLQNLIKLLNQID